MQTFELCIKNEKLKQYRIIALLIIFINVIFFSVLAVSNSEYRIRSLVTTGVILAIFFIQHFAKKNKQEYTGIGTSVFFIILFYIETGYWELAIAIALLSVLYAISIRQLIVYINPDHIIYPSFPKKTIQWDELNNIILKDGLLTIDFKNNKLAQAQVISRKNDNAIDEKEFNDFCKMHLKAEMEVA